MFSRQTAPVFLCNTINFDCGLSDCHNMVAACFKENSISNKRQKVACRSYKNFQEAECTQDLHRVPFHVATIFDDANDCYWAYEKLLMDIVDEHTPQKQKKKKKKKKKKKNTLIFDDYDGLTHFTFGLPKRYAFALNVYFCLLGLSKSKVSRNLRKLHC